MSKKDKGITLVALVVIIIVLIILAGVSINLILGENGVVTRAQQTGEKYAQEEEKERISLAVIASQIQAESYTGKINQEDLEKSLRNELGEDADFTVTPSGENDFILKMNSTNREYEINAGNVVALQKNSDTTPRKIGRKRN